MYSAFGKISLHRLATDLAVVQGVIDVLALGVHLMGACTNGGIMANPLLSVEMVVFE